MPRDGMEWTEVLLHLILYFGVLAFACSEPWSVAVLQILIAILFSVVVWTRRLTISGPAPRFLFPGMMAVVFIGLLQSLHQRGVIDPQTTLLFTTSAWATRKAVLLWLSYCGLVLAAASILDSPERFRRLAWSIFILGVVTAIIGLGLRNEDPSLLLGFRRISFPQPTPFGPFVNRDHAASFLAMAGLLGWGILFSQLARLREARSTSSLIDHIARTTLVLGMNAALAFCIVQTGSRGGTHAFFFASWLIALISAALFSRGRLRIAWLLSLVGACGAYAYALYLFPVWRGYVGNAWTSSLQVRISLYRSGFRMLGDHWLLGVGLGGLRFAFPAYQETLVDGYVEHVHSDWLELLLEVGVVGFICFASVFVAMLVSALRRWLAGHSTEKNALLGGAIGALVAGSFHMLMEFPFQMPGNAVTLLLVACLLSGGSTISQNPSNLQLGPSFWNRHRRWLKAGATILSLGVATLSIPSIGAEFLYLQSPTTSPQSAVYFLTHAMEWDPNPQYALRLGSAYRSIARDNPAARKILLRKGLESIAPFCNDYPADRDLNRLRDNLLLSLESNRM